MGDEFEPEVHAFVNPVVAAQLLAGGHLGGGGDDSSSSDSAGFDPTSSRIGKELR